MLEGLVIRLARRIYAAAATRRRPSMASRRPRLDFPRLRVACLSFVSLSEGIEVHEIEGHRVRVYGVAKTIADLFKARNRVGLDVAVEALREAWRDRRFTMADLEQAARAARVERVLRPYVAGVVA